MTHGMKPKSWVIVNWRDAMGASGWHEPKRFAREALKLTKIRTFGRLVSINKDYLIMASAVTSHGWLQAPHFIPMSLVMSIERVTPVRMPTKGNKKKGRK